VNRAPFQVFLFSGLLLSAAFADTVKLKSGEVVEGTILEATAKEIVIEVQFSASIKDVQRIPRSDVEGIDRATRDEAEFAEIQKTAKIPDTASDPAAHRALINEKLKPFLSRFSYSTRAADVKKMIAQVEEEIARLERGDVKIAGVWYDHEAFEKEKYQIEADEQLEKMKQAMAAGDFVTAANLFETLQRQYPNSAAFGESAPLAEEVVRKLQQQLNFAIANLPQTLTERRQTIERAPAGQRAAIEQAMQAEEQQLAAVADAAQRAGRRFFKIVPFDEKGLKVMETNLRALQQQIGQLNTSALAGQAALARRASRELSEGQLEAAAASVTALREQWPQYEGLARLDQRLKEAEAAAAPQE
jgi:DNA uptake lipoprotein